MFKTIIKSRIIKRSFHSSLRMASAGYLDTKAIITYTSLDSKSLNWKYEPIKVRSILKPHELLIDMKYVGICHTDLAVGLAADPLPRILGHEGVGLIKAIGSDVQGDHKVGDRVALSYSYCEHCDKCHQGDVAYCDEFIPFNMVGTDQDVTFVQAGEDSSQIEGKFFGQSSFAKTSVVNESSVVNLEHLSKSIPEDKFKYLGPFGCGFQTGAGAILKAGALKPGETVVIYGLGGVGFAALLAAKIGGASKVIVVDLLDSKLELALKAGATDVIKVDTKDPKHVRNEILRITNGKGADLSLESVGGSKFVEAAIKNASTKGKIVYVGLSDPTDEIKIPLVDFLMKGKQLISCIEGNATPKEFVPEMIGWFLDGEFPVDEIIKFYKVEDFTDALKDMKDGKVVKPILEF